MGLQIVRGKLDTAVSCVVYGTEGIGKTTLASKFPHPLFLDTEGGTSQLDVARIAINDWPGLEGTLHHLVRDPQGFRTVVIDSADWAERQIEEAVKAKAGKRSIEDFGFGKGYVMVAEQVSRLLGICDQLIARGVNVVFVAHAKVQRVSPPDQTDGFDRYELKMSKHSAPLFKEWADLVLFCNYRTQIVEGSDGRMKAKGGKERIMFAERAPAYDAKNRFGLPAEMAMGIEPLAGLFSRERSVGPAAPASEAAEGLFEQIASYIAAAKNVRTLGKIGDRLDELSSDGQLTEVQIAELLGMVNRRHNELEPVEATDVVA